MEVESEMSGLKPTDRRVLTVLSEGRASPLLIREETDLEKGLTNTILVRLSRKGYTNQVVRGLYEITDEGKEALSSETSPMFSPPLKNSDTKEFPKRANETEQTGYMKWILLGVKGSDFAFYFDRAERTVHQVRNEGGELIEEGVWKIEDRVGGGSPSKRVLTYIETEQRNQTWNRWSECALALKFANRMKTIAPTLLSHRECLVYSMVKIFDISGTTALSFTGETSMSPESEVKQIERKLEEGESLIEFLEEFK